VRRFNPTSHPPRRTRCGASGIGGFAGGIGDGGDIIEAEEFGGLDLRIDHDFVIAGILAVLDVENICRKHHRDGHARKMIGLLSGKNCENSFATCHIESWQVLTFPGIKGNMQVTWLVRFM